MCYKYEFSCVYQWSSVQTANHLGGSERCSESESDNSHSYVCNSLISDFLLHAERLVMFGLEHVTVTYICKVLSE